MASERIELMVGDTPSIANSVARGHLFRRARPRADATIMRDEIG